MGTHLLRSSSSKWNHLS